MNSKNDQLLSEFISQTGLDASFATDFLREKSWDLIDALKAYHAVCGLEQGRNTELDSGLSSLKTTPPICNELDMDPDSTPITIKQDNWMSVFDCHPIITTKLNVVRGLAQAAVSDSKKDCHIETPSYAFTLPNLTTLPADFRQFLEKDIIETTTLRGLEASGHLNWWVFGGAAQKLWPLSTSGDGNCLLHAASLGMWGFHDRLLILRKALYLILTKGSRRHALWRRWRWQQHHANKQAGLIYSETEWRFEWANLVRLASPQPRSKPDSTEPSDTDQNDSLDPPADTDDDYSAEDTYESLEEVHVFALAHILKRPVIVVADTVLRNANGEEFAPIPFGGIYLPLECPSNECHRSPLILCYDAGHFSALVTMQQTGVSRAAIVPITDKDRRLLPVHFACDPGPDFTWWFDEADRRIANRTTLDDRQRLLLLCRYLDMVKISIRRTSTMGRQKTTNLGARTTGSLNAARRSGFNGWTDTLRRKLKWTGKTKGRCLNTEWQDDGEMNVSVAELKDPGWLTGAQVHTDARHQYMDDMVSSYLRSARRRFETAEQHRLAGIGFDTRHRLRRRQRISRSFSTSSLVVSCMNGVCDQPASNATNYLCADCFRHQKQLMNSFTVHDFNDDHDVPDGVPSSQNPAGKSRTMPAMTVTTQESRLAITMDKTTREETKYGVAAITTSAGVTHYYLPVESETRFCRRPHCSNYSNGHPTLCSDCAKVV